MSMAKTKKHMLNCATGLHEYWTTVHYTCRCTRVHATLKRPSKADMDHWRNRANCPKCELKNLMKEKYE